MKELSCLRLLKTEHALLAADDPTWLWVSSLLGEGWLLLHLCLLQGFPDFVDVSRLLGGSL